MRSIGISIFGFFFNTFIPIIQHHKIDTNMHRNPEKKVVWQYLEDHGLAEDYAKFLGKTKSQLKEILNSKTKIKRIDLAAFYAFTGQPPSELGIDIEMDFFDRPDQYDFMGFKDWVIQKKNEDEFVNEYFGKIIEKVEQAKARIFIYDYLIKNKQALTEPLRGKFFKGFQQYFNAIEDHLEKTKDLEYTRILSLPSDLRGAPKFIFDIKDKAIRNTKLAVVLLFEKTFKHICKQFQKKRLNLYAIFVPPRNYSVMLIDKKYVMAEYFRRRRSGEKVPDLLFIDEVNSTKQNCTQRLMAVYDTEFGGLINKKDGAEKVSADLFASCTKELLGNIEAAMKRLAQKEMSAKKTRQKEKLEEWRDDLRKKMEILRKYELI